MDPRISLALDADRFFFGAIDTLRLTVLPNNRGGVASGIGVGLALTGVPVYYLARLHKSK